MVESEGVRRSVAAVLPKHVTAERLLKTVLLAAAKNPDIYNCTPQSVMRAIIQVAELGLEPGSAIGTAYLVPYGKECTLIPSYRGLVELAIRTGEVKSVQARPVYAKDHLDMAYGLDERLEHRPCMESERGDLIAVYAVARLDNGTPIFEFMWKSEVDAIRARSKASDNGPWRSDYVAMALKTVVRRLCTRSLPKSPELLRRAIEMSDEADTMLPSSIPVLDTTTPEDAQALDASLRAELAAADTRKALAAVAVKIQRAESEGTLDDAQIEALNTIYAEREKAIKPGKAPAGQTTLDGTGGAAS